MTTTGHDVPRCPACGALRLESGPFCSHCGRRVGGDTLRLPRTAGWDRRRAKTLPEHVPSLRGFGVLMLIVFAVCLVVTVVASAIGLWIAALVFAPVTVVLALVWVNVMWQELEGPLERLLVQTGTNLWGAMRVAVVSIASWSSAVAQGLQVRARLLPLRRARVRLLAAFGEAVHLGDDDRTRALHDELRSCEEEIGRCEEKSARARRRARGRVRAERDAVAETGTLGAQELHEPEAPRPVVGSR